MCRERVASLNVNVVDAARQILLGPDSGFTWKSYGL